MEWVALITWLLLLPLTGILALTGALTAISLAVQPLFGFAGAVTCALYAFDVVGDRWMAWLSVGLAMITAIIAGIGARALLEDGPRIGTAGETAEEIAASLAGIAIPLLLAAAFAMTLAGAGVTTVV